MQNPFENPSPINPVEKKEEGEKYGKARSYVREILESESKIDRGDNETIEYWQEAAYNLEIGQELLVMESLERMPRHPMTDDLLKWRKAIFEISNDKLTNGHFFSKDQVAELLDKKFEEKQEQMDLTLEKDPQYYSKEDRKTWLKQDMKWKDASNELFTYDRSENALLLIEDEIDNVCDYIDDRRAALKVNPAAKENRKELTHLIEKVSKLRRMRDSLYSIDFFKSDI
ncbi:MAG: hypothetical protein WCG84_02885 [Candidatus Moraniibacteriota bacterium]